MRATASAARPARTAATVSAYYWQAHYSGDANNNPATSVCTDEKIVVNKNAPTITTQASPTTGTVGVAVAAVGDTATFAQTDLVAPPSGSVTFTLYSDAACTSAVAGVSGTGDISTSGGVSTAEFHTSWTPTAAGTYYWIASYPGDANNTGFTTGCGDDNEQITIANAPTPPTSPTPPPTPMRLAVTGVPTGTYLAWAAGLLLAGALILGVSRRRRREH